MSRRFSFPRLSIFQQPLLFISVSFICGLTFAASFQISARWWIVICAIFWLLGSKVLWSENRCWLIITFILSGCFAAGGGLWEINESRVGRDRVRRLFDRGELKPDEPIEVRGVLNSSPELAPDRIYLSIEVERVATLGRELATNGMVQVVVPFNEDESRGEYDSLMLDYGTRVRLLGHLDNRRNYRNPGSPDFDEMLEHRGFDAAGWVKSPLLIERLGEGDRAGLLSILYRIRANALTVILRSFDQPASGILAAALLGNRYFLSRGTAETFRAGGTFHLLVISGLHVAMIAVAALWLAKYLSHSRMIQYALVLLMMWSYALMVGAQPAITRAVVMLTIALIGRLIFRSAAGVNTLAASAVTLLVWQPRDLFNPGFQLSFLTVLMIVVFTSPLYQRLKEIGRWRPTAATPYPPRAPNIIKWCTETLFWDEVEFRREMKESPVRYRLNKSRTASRMSEMQLQKSLRWVAVTVLTTTGIQIGLLPVMTALFHRISIISPIANVLEGALIFALMMAGVVYLLIYTVMGDLASKLAGIVNALGQWTVEICEPLTSWKWASVRVPGFGEATILFFSIYFIAVSMLITTLNEWNPLRKGDGGGKKLGLAAAATASVTIMICGWLLVRHPFEHRYDKGWLSITFLDVGQGDAMLISFPRGTLMMMDAGGRPAIAVRGGPEENEDVFIEDRVGIAEAAVMPYLWWRGIKRLDWIAASHGDADHVEGFTEIVRGFEVGTALKGVGSRPGAPGAFDIAVRALNLPLKIVKRGDRLEIDGVDVEIISPSGDAGGVQFSNNNSSLVLRLSFGERSFLLTGDIEKEAEAEILASGADLKADVLKVAHHGSRTSSTPGFLERVKPRHAVISVAGPSPFGHPHTEVIARLREAGARVWMTKDCGAITISTDGRDLRVATFTGCE